MFNKYIEKSQELIDQGKPFVVALVVNYEGPISGKPGDRAIVTEDGKLWGWVAGGCSQSIIVEEALGVMKTGTSKLIKITPEEEGLNDKVMKRKMTCHSGGTLDVYLEPVIPKPLLVILGDSAVAQKLTLLGKALDYTIVDSLEDRPPKNSFVVVATQGNGDEEALEKALSISPVYLGFIASGKKAKAVREILSSRGIPRENLDIIKAPAGLDIKARSPEEIALSILAEIVLTQREISTDIEPEKVEKAIDPICGMSVNVGNAKHIYEYQDTTYYFCCEGCKNVFAQDPDKYLAASD